MLFSEKAELADWWFLFRGLVVGPRHFVETRVKCQYLWGFSLGQINFPERNYVSACVTTCQLFQEPYRERGLDESYYSTWRFHWVLKLNMPGVLRFITFVIQLLSSMNFQSSASIRRHSILATEPWRVLKSRLENLTFHYVDFQLILLSLLPCFLSEVYAAAFDLWAFFRVLQDKKDYFLLTSYPAGD